MTQAWDKEITLSIITIIWMKVLNKLQVRVTSGQSLYRDYLVLQILVRLFKISFQKKSFLTTLNVENKFFKV